MDFDALYHFLFESYAGIGILIGLALVLSLIYAVIAERKTRRVYKDRGERTDGFFDDDDDDSNSSDTNTKR